jgi:hypothetical protein
MLSLPKVGICPRPSIANTRPCSSAGGATTSDLQGKLDDLHDWGAEGHVLMLSGEEGQRLFGNSPPAWTGRESWAVRRLDLRIHRARVFLSGRPLVKGFSGSAVNDLRGKIMSLRGSVEGRPAKP